MQLVDLKFRPGIDKQDTAYSAGDERKYVDSDFVRFHYGKPERWGGWANLPNPNVTVVGASSTSLSIKYASLESVLVRTA